VNARRQVETATQRAGERLITRACRVIPDRERPLRRQEWVSEQASILDDPTRPWLLRVLASLGFPLSLAWSLRCRNWPTHQSADSLSWRATLNTVATGAFAAYLLVPMLASVSFAVGIGTGAAVTVSTAANIIPGGGVVSVPAVTDDTHLPAIPISAAIVGAIAAIITVVCLTTLVARSWLSTRRSREPDLGQPA
jgi:hypothetical protein